MGICSHCVLKGDMHPSIGSLEGCLLGGRGLPYFFFSFYFADCTMCKFELTHLLTPQLIICTKNTILGVFIFMGLISTQVMDNLLVLLFFMRSINLKKNHTIFEFMLTLTAKLQEK